jgi:hypothetical protein
MALGSLGIAIAEPTSHELRKVHKYKKPPKMNSGGFFYQSLVVKITRLLLNRSTAFSYF